MTLYANWTTNSYTLTYDSNEGSAVISEEVSYNSTATVPPNPIKTGYAFDGWFTDEDLTTAFVFTTAITQNMTLYAKWLADSLTVDFNSNGGTAVSGQTVSYNSAVAAFAVPTKPIHFRWLVRGRRFDVGFRFRCANYGEYDVVCELEGGQLHRNVRQQ